MRSPQRLREALPYQPSIKQRDRRRDEPASHPDPPGIGEYSWARLNLPTGCDRARHAIGCASPTTNARIISSFSKYGTI
jgi:hypothetical protein